MSDLKFEKVSWDRFEKDCLTVSKKLNKLNIQIIVAISRGGLVAGRLFSDFLNKPVSEIAIYSYQNLKQEKETKITETPSRSFKNETLLIVDDVADSGKTFKIAVEYFKTLGVKKIYTLAVYYKSKTQFMPDFVGRKIDAWIIYPYETVETYKSFVQMFGSSEKAKNQMKKVGFKDWQLQDL